MRLVNGRLRPVGQLVKMDVIQGILVVMDDAGIVVGHRVIIQSSPGRRHRRERLVEGGRGRICVGVGRNIRDGISSTFLVDAELLGSVRLRGSHHRRERPMCACAHVREQRRGIEERSGERSQEIRIIIFDKKSDI